MMQDLKRAKTHTHEKSINLLHARRCTLFTQSLLHASTQHSRMAHYGITRISESHIYFAFSAHDFPILFSLPLFSPPFPSFSLSKISLFHSFFILFYFVVVVTVVVDFPVSFSLPLCIYHHGPVQIHSVSRRWLRGGRCSRV